MVAHPVHVQLRVTIGFVLLFLSYLFQATLVASEIFPDEN